jgi:hypothetical protein
MHHRHYGPQPLPAEMLPGNEQKWFGHPSVSGQVLLEDDSIEPQVAMLATRFRDEKTPVACRAVVVTRSELLLTT